VAGDSSEEKTEQPTHKRLRDARKRGQVAKSDELAHAMSLLVCLMTVLALAPWFARKAADLQLAVWRAFEQPGVAVMKALLYETLGLLALASAAPLMAGAVVATAMLWLQTGGIFSAETLKPKMENLNPAQGLKKLWSVRSVVRLVQTLVKLAIVLFAVLIVYRQVMPDAVRIVYGDLGAALQLAQRTLMLLLLWCGGLFVILALADYAFQRWQFLRDQRMSHSEIKREYREDQGHELHKQERRRVAQEPHPKELLQYLQGSAMVVTDSQGRVVVLLLRVRDKQIQPMFLLRATAATGQEVRHEALRRGAKEIISDALVKRLYPQTEPGKMLPPDLADAVRALTRK
jgi:type III secretory pathway component EscU